MVKAKALSNQSIKLLALPFVAAVVLGLLVFIAGNTSYKRITSEYNLLNESQKEEKLLIEKLSTLSETDTSSLDASNRSVVALPEKNPGLFFLSQLKELAKEHGVSITKTEIDQEAPFNETITKGRVGVSLESDNEKAITTYLIETAELAPLSTIESVNIENEEGTLTTEAEFFVYWSKFPESLPALTASISDLSAQDQQTMTKILSLRIPVFTVLNPTEFTDRSDPFQ